jgi:hypothetical protein
MQTLFITLGDGPTGQPTESGARVPDRIPRELNSSACPDRANATPIESIDPACTRPHATQPFFGVAQSFYYIVSHFAAILLY